MWLDGARREDFPVSNGWGGRVGPRGSHDMVNSLYMLLLEREQEFLGAVDCLENSRLVRGVVQEFAVARDVSKL